MNMSKKKKIFTIIIIACMALALCACSKLKSTLPPLPTPRSETPAPAVDFFPQPEVTTDVFAPPVPTMDTMPAPTAEIPAQMPTPPVMTPIPTPAPTPDPTPEPTPEPPREDPNTPHLFIENQTLPESMPRYGVADLYGEIYTDKGVIAMVTGRIFSNDSGEDVQICNFYPYTNTFSLAGTVNAQLIFGVLEPGSYTYIVSAIAENESYSSGSVVLIEHGFQIYYD